MVSRLQLGQPKGPGDRRGMCAPSFICTLWPPLRPYPAASRPHDQHLTSTSDLRVARQVVVKCVLRLLERGRHFNLRKDLTQVTHVSLWIVGCLF
jgi:hypothetical protein